MHASDSHRSPEPEDRIEATAASWLAQRDRGLTGAQQDEYLQWLSEDPRHGRTIARLERAWQALDALAEWRPEHSALPNPDLLATSARASGAPGSTAVAAKHRRRIVPVALVTLGAVAALLAVTVGVFFLRESESQSGTLAGVTPARGVRVIPGPERITLPDGSTVHVNRDAKIETAFTAGERRVRLLRGEAQFTVAKDPARPFVVVAGGVAVRALGTVFDVRHAVAAVEVLVTEGKVQVERIAPSAQLAGTGSEEAAPLPVAAGERVVVPMSGGTTPFVIAVSTTEVERALSWQGVRLEFADLPLSEVIVEFNLRNPRQMIIGDRATGEVRVGGTFRADNVDAFVRLLEASFGVAVERRTDGAFVLRTQAR